MKKFLMLLFVVFTMVTANANTVETNVNTNVINNYYSVELTDTINKVHIAIPCRVIYGTDKSLDTTTVVITDRSQMFNVYYVTKNNIIYIKSNLRQDDLSELEKNKDVNTPIIRIMTKTQTNTPEIIAGSGFNIIQNRSYGKATTSSNN